MKKRKGKQYVIIEKIKSINPSKLDIGDKREGYIKKDSLEIGYPLLLIKYSKAKALEDVSTGYFITTEIIKLNNDSFTTKNSEYKYKFI